MYFPEIAPAVRLTVQPLAYLLVDIVLADLARSVFSKAGNRRLRGVPEATIGVQVVRLLRQPAKGVSEGSHALSRQRAAQHDPALIQTLIGSLLEGRGTHVNGPGDPAAGRETTQSRIVGIKRNREGALAVDFLLDDGVPAVFQIACQLFPDSRIIYRDA